MLPRHFPSHAYLVRHPSEPQRSVVTQSPDATVVAWLVPPGQAIPLHRHPAGQDTWTILAGRARYLVDAEGGSLPIQAGDVLVARTGDPHGVINDGPTDLVFMSVVSPAEAGYERLGA